MLSSTIELILGIFFRQITAVWLPREHHVGKVQSPVDLVLGSSKFTSLFDATTVNGRSIVYTKDDFGKDFQCGNPASVILCLF